MAQTGLDTHMCSKCGSSAIRSSGRVTCSACGHTVRWKPYKKNLKRRNEILRCAKCYHEFHWQEWRRIAHRFSTGNPGPAAQYLRTWPSSKSEDERMMYIDELIQELHGQGPLAAVFVEGSKESVRTLLDELAESP